ncbi:phosphatidylcholine synthase [Actinomyces sp. zg-332]|uniref:CDP-alcohol phosphatidyltransferase family protein n=1 Tax=Actinomyces sp. zg-332 TaxID=2708340 RepID=UPI001423EDD8|nr:CDP-alcohol phosphatidyltransferase family protein [Actinomyces sp. zg-332]QPK93690.1 phosphatidylcholine synthase [Actinomyces sp. zg-332]
MDSDSKSFSLKHKVVAWAVHAFTMSGVVWALLAFLSLYKHDVKMMFFWLLIALIVDGVDGSMARHAKVKEVVPWFDGTALDLIVDYLTYVFVPALFMYLLLPVPSQMWGMVVMIIVCISSMFCFCNTKMKSNDYYFVGFPAVWNIVALVFYIMQTSGWTNVIVTIILAVLHLSTIKFLHPFRVKTLRLVNISMVIIWCATSVILVYLHPLSSLPALIIWYISGMWIVGIGIWRTISYKVSEN